MEKIVITYELNSDNEKNHTKIVLNGSASAQEVFYAVARVMLAAGYDLQAIDAALSENNNFVDLAMCTL